jgi:uncharacterized protein
MIRAGALFAMLVMPVAGQAMGCADDRVTVSGDWGHANFSVTIADTGPERSQGLMNVPQMPLMTGMLFVYDSPHAASFWMHNTLIPLDMLFAGPDGTILSVHENAHPMDDTSIPGGDGIQYVLEINGGLAGRLGIAVGDVLQHPSFGPDAAMPCE